MFQYLPWLLEIFTGFLIKISFISFYAQCSYVFPISYLKFAICNELGAICPGEKNHLLNFIENQHNFSIASQILGK